MEVPETHFVYTSQVQGSLVLNKKLRNYFIYGILPPAISLSLSLSGGFPSALTAIKTKAR
jgi:hypothetical protein